MNVVRENSSDSVGLALTTAPPSPVRTPLEADAVAAPKQPPSQPSQPGAAGSDQAGGLVLPPAVVDPAAEEEEEVYRWPELLCVYVAIIADAIVQNVIAPYAVSWIRDSFQVGDRNVGLYSGLLVGSFAFATALTSPFFGWLSDIVGRRILMASGLFSAGLLTLIGGLSGSYWASFTMRFLAGLLDACQTVSFAAIGDITTGNARFVAFGYAKAASQIAKILTSLIGGLTYNVKPDPLFKRLPGYDTVLLSHLIAFGSCLAGVLLIVALYREGPEFNKVSTRIKRVRSAIRLQQRDDSVLSLVSAASLSELIDFELLPSAPGSGSHTGGGSGSHTGGVILGPLPPPAQRPPQPQQHHMFFFNSPARSGRSQASVSPARGARQRRRPLSERLVLADELTFEDEPTLLRLMTARRRAAAAAAAAAAEGGADLSHASGRAGVTPAPSSPPHHASRSYLSSSLATKPSFLAGLRYVLTKGLLLRLILVYSLTSFLNAGLMLSIMLLAQAKEGYDMSPKDASIIMLLFGSWAIVFNALFFKPVVARLGQKRANGIGLLLTGIGVLGLPIGDYYIRAHTPQLWSCIVITVLVFGAGYMLINSILASFISLHASHEMQGIAQGVATFCSQILSGLGPIAIGALNNAVASPIPVFLCLTAGYAVAYLTLVVVPRDVLEKKGRGKGAEDD